tara:strand:+ start:427 stop:3039 length:2613 start_codon:yes stop_codon:yes gene_type:complete
MRRVKVPISNFQFGEISPSLISRTDSAVYAQSAQKVENLFLRAEGGVIKRAGLKHLYEFDTTFEEASFTITVSDYGNIIVGSTIKFFKGDGTLITLEFETAGGSSPSSSSGNTHYVRANTDNNTTADNIYTAINAISGFTVANPSAAVVTVTRDDPFHGRHLTVESSDTVRLATTNFGTDMTQQHRLIPFIFSDDERYIVSLEHQKIRVFYITPVTQAVSLVSTITQDVDSAALPITNLNIHEVTYAQSGDTMFICHQTFMVRMLVRTSLSTFQMDTYSFDQNSAGTLIHQPYYSFQPTGMTLDPSHTSGTSKTAVTSAAYFDVTGSSNGSEFPDSLHKNIVLRYHGAEIKIISVQSATSATVNIFGTLKKRLEIDSFRTTEGTATILVTQAGHGFAQSDAITIADSATVGGIARGDINGSRTVAEVVDENRFTFNAAANATSSSSGGGTPTIETHATSTDWGEQSYSALRGFPAAVTFHQNRLWFGGTSGQPDGIWGSKTGVYFNFDVGDAEDNDALDLTASIGEINTIRHMVSNRDLQIFTSTSEMTIPAFNEKPTTPTNAQIKRETPFGASHVRPQVFDGATIYVQTSGDIVREFLFTDSEDAYTAQAISMLSSHLIKQPTQMTTLTGAIDRAESYIFMTDADGTIAIFNSNRSEKRAGWSQFTMQGSFHSLCTIDTRVYMVVAIDKGAGTSKYILCEFDSSKNTDVSTIYTGSAGVFNVSSDYDNGAVLDVVSGSNYLGQFTVAGGNIDVSAVDNSLISAEIGLKYDVNLHTNPLDAVVGDGPLTGEPRGVNKVTLDLNSTLSVSVNSKDLIIRQVTDDLSQNRTAVTGKKEFRLLGYSKDPQVLVSQSAPLPMQVNSIVAEVSFS